MRVIHSEDDEKGLCRSDPTPPPAAAAFAMSGSLLSGLPSVPEQEERFETLLEAGSLRIERIISTGQRSPDGHWYDQATAEWVLLVQGKATLRFEDEALPRHLIAGDWVEIAPHRRHRVDSTQQDPPTVWLAVHRSG